MPAPGTPRDEAARPKPLSSGDNRQGFESRVTQSLAECRHHGLPACLGVIDIDGFRALREGLAPDASNALLRRFGDLLANVFRSTDIIARRMAGEFWVFMPGGTEAGFQAALDLLKAQGGDLACSAGVVALNCHEAVALGTLFKRAVENLEIYRDLRLSLQQALDSGNA